MVLHVTMDKNAQDQTHVKMANVQESVFLVTMIVNIVMALDVVFVWVTDM